MANKHVVWRRLDKPGHEAVQLRASTAENILEGSAIFVEDDPCSIHYRIVCTGDWVFTSATVHGWFGDREIDLRIAAREGEWTLNGELIRELQSCIDFDLNFSPSTNTIPRLRLQIPIGGKAAVSAAWLRFQSLTLERLDQSYTRTSEHTYMYETADGEFKRELTVNDAGLVTSYPGVWELESC